MPSCRLREELVTWEHPALGDPSTSASPQSSTGFPSARSHRQEVRCCKDPRGTRPRITPLSRAGAASRSSFPHSSHPRGAESLREAGCICLYLCEFRAEMGNMELCGGKTQPLQMTGLARLSQRQQLLLNPALDQNQFCTRRRDSAPIIFKC